MILHVEKWDGSLGIRIPKALAEAACVSEGTAVELSMMEGKVIVQQAPAKKYRLEDLANQITEANRHQEIDFGAPAGREVW